MVFKKNRHITRKRKTTHLHFTIMIKVRSLRRVVALVWIHSGTFLIIMDNTPELVIFSLLVQNQICFILAAPMNYFLSQSIHLFWRIFFSVSKFDGEKKFWLRHGQKKYSEITLCLKKTTISVAPQNEIVYFETIAPPPPFKLNGCSLRKITLQHDKKFPTIYMLHVKSMLTCTTGKIAK